MRAILCYRPLDRRGKVEIGDEEGSVRVFDNLRRAAIGSGLLNQSVIKYAIDHGRPFVKRRTDKKIFYVREI